MPLRLLCCLLLLSPGLIGQTEAPAERVAFTLNNGLNYHRMFRVEGPGIAYGFSMNKRERLPCLWPVGAKLHFSTNGEDTTGLILTVSADDAGRTLSTAGRSTAAEEGRERIRFRLRNPGLLPKRVALISYQPQQRGNGTNVFWLAPLASKSFDFPVGTRLYLADEEQVDTVMSGRRIDGGTPFLVVSEELARKSVSLR